MTKFNTHGGHFSPTGYFRVNVGGTHEENPNGGVQVGTDTQGIPNMLEEGEPVYDDFVYSDNIAADGELLEKHNIPKKYAGKLYSQIADAFVDEAEERPNDPISNGGLNAMLVRLADAQEEQKQIKEQKELEDELSSLSPEELAALEEALAQQEAASAEAEVPESVVQETVPQEMPAMAYGGMLRKYGNGGGIAGDTAVQVAAATDPSATTQSEKDLRLALAAERLKMAEFSKDSTAAAARLRRAQRRYNRAAQDVEAFDASADNGGGIGLPGPVVSGISRFSFPNSGTFLSAYGRALDKQQIRKEELDSAQEDYDEYLSGWKGRAGAPSGNQIEIDWAYGGAMNRYDFGGIADSWDNFLKNIEAYKTSRIPGGTSKTYKIDTQFPLGTEYESIKALEDSANYKRFTDYVLANSSNENVRNYLKALDAGTAPSVRKLFDAKGHLVKGWEDLYRNRRYDQKGGIYHFSPDDVNAVIAQTQLRRTALERHPQMPMVSAVTQNALREALPLTTGAQTQLRRAPDIKFDTEPNAKSGTTGYSTAGMYAGPAFNLLAAAHNALQDPDRYDFGHVEPTFVNGRLALQRQQYNPVDMQTAVNQWQANQNAGHRAISNSGYGASLPVVQLAAMYSGNQGYGNALKAARQYNDKHRAGVIAQNNTAASTEADFYNRLNAANANIANQNALYNHRLAMQHDLYNKQAESARFDAISRALEAGAIDLGNMARQNFAANQVNSNRANLGYATDLNGIIRFLAALNAQKNE